MPTTDQGSLQGRYRLIPRTLIFLTCGDQVLLLKGGSNKHLWAGLYNGVGGHVERGEDVLTAARRELLEETGLAIPDLWLCGTITIDAGEETGIGIFVLRGEYYPNGRSSISPISPDGTLEWVPISRVTELPLVEDLPVLLPRVLSTRRGDPPFSACSAYDRAGRLVVIFG